MGFMEGKPAVGRELKVGVGALMLPLLRDRRMPFMGRGRDGRGETRVRSDTGERGRRTSVSLHALAFCPPLGEGLTTLKSCGLGSGAGSG